MDLIKAREQILSADQVKELYILELDLTGYVSVLYRAIMLAETEMDKGEQKSKLSMANTLLGICRERQEEVRNAENRYNYNFRMAAKTMLKKETFNAINQQSLRYRSEVKQDSRQMRENKIE